MHSFFHLNKHKATYGSSSGSATIVLRHRGGGETKILRKRRDTDAGYRGRRGVFCHLRVVVIVVAVAITITRQHDIGTTLAVEVTALLPSLRPAPSRCAAARSAWSREADEHERGGVHRASRGDFAQASPHARTHAGGGVGGRSLCFVRLPRAWAHADRQRHARAQHAEAERLAAAHAAPRMHAAHARRTQARGSGTRAAGGRSLYLVRLPRAWAHADRQRHTRAQHAEAARLAAAHAAPRMHAAHARCTQARGSGTRAAAAAPATGDFHRPRRSSHTSGVVRLTPKTRGFSHENPLYPPLYVCVGKPRTRKW